jgi:hypothetical protein
MAWKAASGSSTTGCGYRSRRKSFNDTGEPGWIPFNLWPAQQRIIRELYDAYLKQEWRVMFKARGVGGTYVAEALEFWLWWATPNFLALMGSRKEEEVDKASGKKAKHPLCQAGRLSRPPARLAAAGRATSARSTASTCS